MIYIDKDESCFAEGILTSQWWVRLRWHVSLFSKFKLLLEVFLVVVPLLELLDSHRNRIHRIPRLLPLRLINSHPIDLLKLVLDAADS